MARKLFHLNGHIHDRELVDFAEVVGSRAHARRMVIAVGGQTVVCVFEPVAHRSLGLIRGVLEQRLHCAARRGQQPIAARETCVNRS
jgi:hypothetical protein